MQLAHQQISVLFVLTFCLCSVESVTVPTFAQMPTAEHVQKLIGSGHAKEAIPYLDKVLKENPSNQQALLMRGIANEALDLPQKALPDFNHLIELDKKVCRYYRQRSHVLVELGRNNDALNDLNESIRLAESPREKFFSTVERGKVWRILGKNQNAIDDFTRALAMKPDASTVYKERGNAEGESNRWKEAVKDYTSAITNSSPHEIHVHSYYSLRAAAYRKLGDVKHAEKDEAVAKSTIDNQFGKFFDPTQ